MVYGVIVICFLPHTPNDAKFLTEDDKQYASARLRADAHGAAATDAKYEKFSWTSVKLALLNVNTILMSFNFFLTITPIYSFSLFLPTIIETVGFGEVVTQLLTVPPNMVGFLTVLLICYASDKFQKRGMFMLIGTAIAIAGYIMLIATPDPWTQYAGQCFAYGTFSRSHTGRDSICKIDLDCVLTLEQGLSSLQGEFFPAVH